MASSSGRGTNDRCDDDRRGGSDNVIVIDDSDDDNDPEQPRLENESRKDDNCESISIKWRQQKYEITRPELLTDWEEIWTRAKLLGQMDSTIAKSQDLQHQLKLQKLIPCIEKVFKFLYSKKDLCKDIWNPTRLQSEKYADCPEGVYGLMVRRGVSEYNIKYGMGFDCCSRAKCQSPQVAFLMKDIKALKNLIPTSDVDFIAELCLPGIQHHPDHVESSRAIICMQIYEGYLASIDPKCITKTIFERLLQHPPTDVTNLVPMLSIPENRADIQQFFRNFSRDKVHLLLSWPTMKSVTYKLAVETHPEYLGTRIRRDLPEGEFCTLHCIQRALGKTNVQGWENCVKESPRQAELNQFVETVHPLLDSANPDVATETEINEAFEEITGANRESYIRPKPKDLRDAFLKTFQDCNESPQHPKDQLFYVEKSTFLAANGTEWWESEIAGGTPPIHLFGDKYDLTLVTTKSGRRIIVTRAFFLAFSPEKSSWAIRQQTVKSMLALLELMQDLGIHDANYVESERSILVSYLMQRNGDNDVFRRAARFALAEGHMEGPMPYSMTVPRNIDLDANDHYYILFRLGDEKFTNFLKIRGMMKDPYQNAAVPPSHPSWKCPGVPAAGNIPKKECCGKTQTYKSASDKRLGQQAGTFPIMAGAKLGRAHCFRGMFLCGHCHRMLECRERATLAELNQQGELSEIRKRRLDVLESRTGTSRRNKIIEKDGAEAVFDVERGRVNQRPRLNEAIAKRNAVQSKRDKGRCEERRGEHRGVCKTRDKKEYPDALMDALEEGCRWFQQERGKCADGSPFDSSLQSIHALLGRILHAERNQYKSVRDDGVTSLRQKAKWRPTQLRKAVMKHLEASPTVKNYWRLKATSIQGELKLATGRKVEDIQNEVLKKLFDLGKMSRHVTMDYGEDVLIAVNDGDNDVDDAIVLDDRDVDVDVDVGDVLVLDGGY